jgi:hypothetical protein
MTFQPEAWLMLVALFLYFFDALLLLHRDQALVMQGPRGWRPRFGMREWTIAGKEPLLPNPFTGFRPAYLVRWHLFANASGTPVSQRLDENFQLDALGVAVIISTGCLFVLLPLGLFTRAGSVLTIFTAALVTLNNLVALLIVFKRRGLYRIDLRHFTTLATECLLCPPFSLNLVRKICALQLVDEDLESISARLFDAADRATMREACLARVDDALLSLAEHADEEHALRDTRSRFAVEEKSS